MWLSSISIIVEAHATALVIPPDHGFIIGNIATHVGGAGCGGDGGWDAVCGWQDFDDVADEGVFAGMYEGMCDGDFLDYG